jgi:signal transduction histidine kinase
MIQAQGASMHELGGPSRNVPRGRELQVVGDIAHAVLRAARPIEVYRLALERAAPLIGAHFSSVFLRDPADPTLLKLECAYNWPQSAARFLGQVRIREGRGPTGRAVAENVAVEVEDVFADGSLQDWWDPARELGFASLISLPLAADGAVGGALTFYFQRPHRFAEEERRLLALIADQLAVTASRAHLLEEVRRANECLHERNAELARQLEQGEELRRLKDEFVANVSHELRTPLTSIIGYAQLLAEGELGDLAERQANAVRRIESAGSALLRLIVDLLDLSQLELARVPVTISTHDATVLSRTAIDHAPAPHDGVRFTLRTPAAPACVETDGEKVVCILANLLSNAFKFTPHGEVSLEVSAEQAGSITWAVRDSGIGISERNQEAIFDEFRQVDGSTTRLYGGTGLGLALSRRLAGLLGGTISVESTLGNGSVFTLRLPARERGV